MESPTSGVRTDTATLSTFATSAGVIVARNSVIVRNVVSSAEPFHKMTEFGSKCNPTTANVRPVRMEPGVTDAGVSDLTTGTDRSGEIFTMNPSRRAGASLSEVW